MVGYKFGFSTFPLNFILSTFLCGATFGFHFVIIKNTQNAIPFPFFFVYLRQSSTSDIFFRVFFVFSKVAALLSFCCC